MVFRNLIFASFCETRKNSLPTGNCLSCEVLCRGSELFSSVELLKGVTINGTMCISATHGR